MKTNWINSSDKLNLINGEFVNEISYEYEFNRRKFRLAVYDKNYINVSIPDEDAEKIGTIGQAISYLKENVS